jgi:hypothetical protein
MKVMYYKLPYMVKNRVKIPSIRTVFEKEDKGNYTKDALLYQDILRYSRKTSKRKFTLREIGFWLLENNNEFIIRYDEDKKRSSKKNTSKSNRFANVRDRVEVYLKNLVSLNLLFVRKIKAEKVNTLIDLFVCSNEGNFMALLLERENLEKRGNINDKLFDLIQLMFKKNDSSLLLYLSKLYTKFKDNKILDNVIDLLQQILHTNSNLKSVLDAVIKVPVTWSADNKKLMEQFRNITLQTINNELDKHTRDVILFNVKSGSENKILRQHPPREYEEIWIKYIYDNSKVTLYGNCDKCKAEYPIVVKTLEFMNNLTLSPGFPITDCIRCNAKESLEVRPIISDNLKNKRT